MDTTYLQRDGQHKAIIFNAMVSIYLQRDGQHKAIIFSAMVSIRQLYSA